MLFKAQVNEQYIIYSTSKYMLFTAQIDERYII